MSAKEWIYGRNPVFEALRAQQRQFYRLLVAENAQEKGRLAEVVQLTRKANIAIEQAPRSRLDRIGGNNQGVALEVSGYPYCALADILERAAQRQEEPFLLILDALQDPQNLGTLLRTAEAVGVHGVLLPFRRAAAVTPAVVNASSGASEHLLIAQANLAQTMSTLKETGLWVIGLESDPEAQLPEQMDLSGPLALVVGSEGQGLRRLVSEKCDLLMRLPMRGEIESLNAAVAGSIALYLAWGARGYT